MSDMRTEDFWSLIARLNGEITDESLLDLQGALYRLKVAEIVAFQKQLNELMGQLAAVRLCYPGEAPALGDGRLALDLAVVAAGREVFESLADRSGQVVEVDLLADFALELGDLAPEIYEERSGRPWPDPELNRALGRINRIWAGVLGSTASSDSPFTAAVRALLAKWEKSDLYAEAVVAKGFYVLRCEGFVNDPEFPEPKPGTRWNARAGNGAIVVRYVIDRDDLPAVTAEAGEHFVRAIVDRLAKRHGLPTADETFGPQAS